jgi:hypothetical protein
MGYRLSDVVGLSGPTMVDIQTSIFRFQLKRKWKWLDLAKEETPYLFLQIPLWNLLFRLSRDHLSL